MTHNVTYRALDTLDDFHRVVALQMTIWDMPPAEAIPTHALLAITHNGGILIGAESAGELVGFTLAFPGRRGDQWLLWSDMTGVIKAQQGGGIGFQLKQAQRRWALDHGYSVIGWTFDPLQRSNANFNFCRLGARAETYLVNWYGRMNDGINAGLPSDRFEVAWHLADERVTTLAEGGVVAPLATDCPNEAFLLRAEGDKLVTAPLNPDQRVGFAEIPHNLSALKETNIDQAQAWQLAFRAGLLSALAAGYIVADFVTQADRCWYVLTKTR